MVVVRDKSFRPNSDILHYLRILSPGASRSLFSSQARVCTHSIDSRRLFNDPLPNTSWLRPQIQSCATPAHETPSRHLLFIGRPAQLVQIAEAKCNTMWQHGWRSSWRSIPGQSYQYQSPVSPPLPTAGGCRLGLTVLSLSLPLLTARLDQMHHVDIQSTWRGLIPDSRLLLFSW